MLCVCVLCCVFFFSVRTVRHIQAQHKADEAIFHAQHLSDKTPAHVMEWVERKHGAEARARMRREQDLKRVHREIEFWDSVERVLQQGFQRLRGVALRATLPTPPTPRSSNEAHHHALSRTETKDNSGETVPLHTNALPKSEPHIVHSAGPRE